MTKKTQQHYRTCAMLWFAITLTYVSLRVPTLLVWDDTPRIAANLYDSSIPTLWTGTKTMGRSLMEAFAHTTPSGYRPVSHFINLVGIAYFSTADTNYVLWFTAVGAVIGLLAACMYSVSRSFLHSSSAALLSVFLFLCSAPFITGAWIVFAGIQAIVPLMICVGLVFYFRLSDKSARKQPYVTGLLIVMLLGPWFREFVGILPLLIIFLELQRHGRPTILTGVALLFFLHAIFPTALIKMVLVSDLPLRPIFAMGLLGNQLIISGAGTISSFADITKTLRYDVPLHFVSLYPPVLLIPVLITPLIPTIVLAAGLIKRMSLPISRRKPWNETSIDNRLLRSLLFTFLSMAAAAIYHFADPDLGILLWFCTIFGFAGWNRDFFLTWWFFLSFLPFLKIFTEQVHLAYCLVPASIIIVAALEDLWTWIRGRARLLRYSFVALLALALGDHLLNLYGSLRVVQSINNGILTLSRWFRLNVPEGSFVITNALHLEDVRLFSGGHITVFWTVEAGIPLPSRAIDTPSKLQDFLQENEGKRNVYFLNVDFNYSPEKAQYHSHKYIWDETVAVEKIGLIHTTRAYYPYLDPLKIFVSRPFISFLGPPDLENDFYRGPAGEGLLFMREVYAEYHIYKVIGTSVHPWNSTGPVRLHTEGYRGFNILVLNGRFFAIPQSEGAFDLQKIRKKMYSMSFVADDYEKILGEIDHALEQEPDADQSVACSSPSLRQFKVATLIEEGYRRYNILGYGSRIYAIPQGEGVFEIERIQKNEYSRWFSGCSLKVVKQEIDQSALQK